MAVAGLLDGEGWVGTNGHLLALAVQVVLESPCLAAGRQHLDLQPAAVGQCVGLFARLGVVDRRRLEGVVDVAHSYHLAETMAP